MHNQLVENVNIESIADTSKKLMMASNNSKYLRKLTKEQIRIDPLTFCITRELTYAQYVVPGTSKLLQICEGSKNLTFNSGMFALFHSIRFIFLLIKAVFIRKYMILRTKRGTNIPTFGLKIAKKLIFHISGHFFTRKMGIF